VHSLTAFTAHSAVVFADSKNSGGATTFLLPVLILLFAGVMFTSSRRNKRRAAETAHVVMQPGAEIVTRSGMLGTVVEATSAAVTIEVAPGVHIKMLPAAVISRNDPSLQRPRGLGAGRRSFAATPSEAPDAEKLPDPETHPGTDTEPHTDPAS
jgi:preprotein translocase YajC subunit